MISRNNKDSDVFIKCCNVNDVYKNIKECISRENCKILMVFRNIITENMPLYVVELLSLGGS